MRVRGRGGRGAALVGAVVLSTGALVFAVGASAGAASVEKSFEDDGEHEWAVPAGVCWVTVEAAGAQGGDVLSGEGELTVPGGLGGEATARIAVTPGETLWVNVGEAGEDARQDGVPGEGGFNGGGDGGDAGAGRRQRFRGDRRRRWRRVRRASERDRS